MVGILNLITDAKEMSMRRCTVEKFEITTEQYTDICNAANILTDLFNNEVGDLEIRESNIRYSIIEGHGSAAVTIDKSLLRISPKYYGRGISPCLHFLFGEDVNFAQTGLTVCCKQDKLFGVEFNSFAPNREQWIHRLAAINRYQHADVLVCSEREVVFYREWSCRCLVKY